MGMETGEFNNQYAQANRFGARAYLSARFGTNPRGWAQWLFGQMAFPPRARVLDLCCGSAVFWERNLDRLPADADILLTDPREDVLAQAKSRLGACASRFAFDTVKTHIPYAEAYFDIVLSHRTPALAKQNALAVISRVLRPNGVFYAPAAGAASMRELHALFCECFPKGSGQERPPGFCLENGRGQLEEFFDTVAVREYVNTLLVSEAWPLVGYVLSAETPPAERLTPERARVFEKFLECRIRKEGCIRVTKRAGLFIASNRARS